MITTMEFRSYHHLSCEVNDNNNDSASLLLFVKRTRLSRRNNNNHSKNLSLDFSRQGMWKSFLEVLPNKNKPYSDFTHEPSFCSKQRTMIITTIILSKSWIDLPTARRFFPVLMLSDEVL
ncbi:uncharacterized protein LOC131650236 [Vicia villosa]|uniref:uncharacterized protein LOC131650236 n=1 Tax=Vicia villosa TaxID=3911 RepID=UPI00273B76C5|nr:uncharacterized protein LOC131650236 [Vicia villosa]